MATTQYIKKYDGTSIGILETCDDGDQVAMDFVTREILGYYRKLNDVTTDKFGQFISRGNTVVSLIFNRQ